LSIFNSEKEVRRKGYQGQRGTGKPHSQENWDAHVKTQTGKGGEGRLCPGSRRQKKLKVFVPKKREKRPDPQLEAEFGYCVGGQKGRRPPVEKSSMNQGERGFE